MLVEQETNTIVRSKNFKESQFTIKADPKAFAILSEGLYSDKILAIVRELSTNAYDAHVAAGTLDKAFVVHLPNHMEKFFSIRDYGTGLSRKDILHLYTTYFDSNKTDSNDYVGCLGLGSKSPFSYTDSFTVDSFFEGKKSTYNAFINEERLPVIALMNEQKTDEPNGLCVTINVKQQDIYNFESRAQQIYSTFDCPIKFTGRQINITKPKYEFKTSRIGIKERDSSTRIIMGNVAYDVDFDQLSSNVGDLFRNVGGFDIFCKIGEAEVTASRESLSYTKSTIHKLEKVFTDAEAELIKHIDDKLVTATSLWEANLIFNTLGKFNRVKKITWKGQPVNGYTELDGTKAWDMLHFFRRNTYYGYTSKISKSEYGLGSRHSFHPTTKSVFLINDIKKGHIKTARELLLNDKADQVYVIDPSHKDDVQKTLDVPDSYFWKASDHYVATAGVYGGGTGVRKSKVFEWVNNGGRRNNTEYWKDVTVDPTNNTFDCYVEISNYKLQSKIMGMDVSPKVVDFTFIKAILGRDIKLLGIKPTLKEEFEEAGMIDLDEFIKKELVKSLKDEHLEGFYLYKNYNSVDTPFNSAINEFCSVLSRNECVEIDNFLVEKERIEKAKNKHTDKYHFYEQLENLGGKIPEKKVPCDLTKLLSEVECKYPLLPMFNYTLGQRDGYSYNSDRQLKKNQFKQLLKDYIAQCNKNP